MNQDNEFEVQCTSCQARLKVPTPGMYRCPKCATVFEAKRSFTHAGETLPDARPLPDLSAKPDANLATEQRPAAGAYCENHPDQVATAVCQSCGKLICATCQTTIENKNICRECSSWTVAASAAPYGRRPTGPEAGIAWETQSVRGFFSGFGRAIIDSLIRPTKFFTAMSPQGNLWRAFYFGIIIQSLVIVISTGLMMINLASFDPASMLEMFGDALPPQVQEIFENLSSYVSPSYLLPMMLTAPLSAAAGIILLSLFLHLFLLLFGGAKNGLEATIKVVSYSATAQLVSLLPACGGIIAWVWQVVIVVIGLTQAHRTTTGRALAAALTPILVVIGLVLFGLVLVAGLIAQFIGN